MIQAKQISRHNGKISKGRYTQDWTIGNEVKVGFMTLKVIDYKLGVYKLESAKGVQYEFEAHQGLNKIESKLGE